MAQLSVIGKNVPKIDAVAKATGKAKFVTEEGIGLPGMLHGKVLFSPHAHARILSINTSKARSVRGVKLVMTGKDTPSHRAGLLIDDRHILCHEVVRFAGDAVAVVAADSEEAAAKAISLIEVEYEQLPAVFDVEEAMKADCKVVLHPDLPGYNRPAYGYMGDNLPGPNVHSHHKIRKGDVEKAFEEADIIVENRFTNDRIIHCQLEPFNCVCYPQDDGSIELWTSARLFLTHGPLCHALNVPPSKVRMRTASIGGMFGMVGRPERFAALVTMKTGKPCKFVYTREECFIDGLNRLPKTIYVKDGIKKDGTIIAREIKVLVNTGAYTDHAPLTMRNGAFHAVQYRIPNYKWDAYGVYTNEPCCGPMRGFGSAEVFWATEQQMDIAAEKLGMDPLEFRLRNTPDEGEVDVRGQKVHSTGAKECLKKVAEWIEWDKPSVQPSEKHIKVAKGLALGNKYTMADTASSAEVKVHPDGTAEAFHGGDDCGQGLHTVVAQIVAEELSMPIEKVRVVYGDTARVPYDFGTASSRSTLYIGNAVRLAAIDARRQIFELAAPILNTQTDNLSIKDGKISPKDDPQKAIDLMELTLGRRQPIGMIRMATCLEEGAEIIGKATFWGRPTDEDYETGQGERLTISYAYGAQAAEVAVDTETGHVKVLRLASAFDTGVTIHPKMCAAQIEGGAAMGLGCALYEGFILGENGQIRNPNMHDYKIPSSMEMPSGENLGVFMVEDPHAEGPYGAKGMSEASMCPTAPAIGNAVYNALGVRVHAIPMTPERVWEAIENAKDKSD